MTAGEKVKRLDRFLVYREPNISRSRLQRLIELGRIRINEQQVKSSHRIHPGDRITMDVPEPGRLKSHGETVPLDILFEDHDLLVLNKPAGIVVHPASGNWTGTLVNALLHHFQNTPAGTAIEKRERPGIVHRLDKQTSGVMVVAKTDVAHRALADQFKRHAITRLYDAFVWQVPHPPSGTIRLEIGRDLKRQRTYSAKTDRPRDAVTEYRVERQFGTLASHVKLSPRTGRTHQLRAAPVGHVRNRGVSLDAVI